MDMFSYIQSFVTIICQIVELSPNLTNLTTVDFFLVEHPAVSTHVKSTIGPIIDRFFLVGHLK